MKIRNSFIVFLVIFLVGGGLVSFKNSDCSEIVWYRFIGGKPDMRYVKASQSVAKEWGFTIQYEYGICGNTIDDKMKSAECKSKSEQALKCLAEKFGENWQEIFTETVKNRVALNSKETQNRY